MEYSLNGILTCMVEEAETLPPEAVDMVLAQFFHADPNVRTVAVKSKKHESAAKENQGQHKLQKPLPPSYTVAKNICNSCVSQMARYLSQYFSSVITRASDFNANDEGEVHAELSDEELRQLGRAHRLLRELWKACPGVLQNVIPQIEAELSAQNVQIRSLATQTVGDMVAGIGAGGEISPPSVNPSTYPLQTGSSLDEPHRLNSNSQSFSQTHLSAYNLFIARRYDKAWQLRSACTQSIGRILATSVGGTDIEQHVESQITSNLTEMLQDSDERVRIAAISAVELLNVAQLLRISASRGGINTEGSVLYNLAERCKDRKVPVRSEAMRCLAKLWTMALEAIIDGDEEVKQLLGSAPSTVLNVAYLNDPETNAVLDQALFEYLCPVNYPSTKSKEKSITNGGSLTVNGSDAALDADAIRTERMLVLMDSLDEKAKVVFTALITRPRREAPYVKAFLQRCEDYNGGVVDEKKNEADVKQRMNDLIKHLCSKMASPERSEQDLKKFAKDHDRRSYALIRFCMANDSDYRKIQKSLKELERKMNGYPPQNATVWETVRTMTLRASNVFSNRSHIRPIITYTQSDEHGLRTAAHELLKLISTETPDIFKSHSVELCKSLVVSAPQEFDIEQPSSIDALKACASFARKFPGEMPKDRNFSQAMVHYALYGSPPAAAKHAVTVLLSSTDSKQMYATDLTKRCIDEFQLDAQHALTRLACLSQLMRLAAEDLEDEVDTITDIAINSVLKSIRTPFDANDKTDWTADTDSELDAKIWALKILVNRLRHYEDPHSVSTVAPDIYKMLNLLVATRGELSRSPTSPTPLPHRSRLHLEAAYSLLKLSAKQGFDALLSPTDFHALCLTAQDPIPQVRSNFTAKLRKLLGSDSLSARFYLPIFLLAYEPTERLREQSATWLRGQATKRRAAQERAAQERAAQSDSTSTARRAQPVLEACISRFISLLAHHPDFANSPTDLIDFGKYFTFYLSCVATQQNVGLIHHIAQRVKSVADNVTTDKESWEDETDPSERLYILSDLCTAIVRRWEEIKGWGLRVPAHKIGLPALIFRQLPNSNVGKQIAGKDYLPPEVADSVDGIVRDALAKPKKRKSEPHAEDTKTRKRPVTVKSTSTKPRTQKRPQTPVSDISDPGSESEAEWGSAKPSNRRKRRASKEDETPSSERRKSSRAARVDRKSYADTHDSADEADLMDWQVEAPLRSKAKGKAVQQAKSKGKGEVAQTNRAGSGDELSDVPEDLSEHGSEEEEDRDDDVAEAEGKEDASPTKDAFDVPADEEEDEKNESSKGNAGGKKRAPATKEKAAPKKSTPKKAEPRAGTRASSRRAKA